MWSVCVKNTYMKTHTQVSTYSKFLTSHCRITVLYPHAPWLDFISLVYAWLHLSSCSQICVSNPNVKSFLRQNTPVRSHFKKRKAVCREICTFFQPDLPPSINNMVMIKMNPQQRLPPVGWIKWNKLISLLPACSHDSPFPWLFNPVMITDASHINLLKC